MVEGGSEEYFLLYASFLNSRYSQLFLCQSSLLPRQTHVFLLLPSSLPDPGISLPGGTQISPVYL